MQIGFILISPANLSVIVLLVLVFALAVLLRIPGERQVSTVEPSGPAVVGATTTSREEQP
jgi:hypothetical protein